MNPEIRPFALTFTTPESFPSGQFWGIYALIGGVRVKYAYTTMIIIPLGHRTDQQHVNVIATFYYSILELDLHECFDKSTGRVEASALNAACECRSKYHRNTDNTPKNGDFTSREFPQLQRASSSKKDLLLRRNVMERIFMKCG